MKKTHSTHNAHYTHYYYRYTYLVRRDAGMFPGLARAHVLRDYLFPNLLHHGIRRALQLIGVALDVTIREVRGILASGRAGRADERQSVRVVKVREDEIAGCRSCGPPHKRKPQQTKRRARHDTTVAHNVAGVVSLPTIKKNGGRCGLKAREENDTGENELCCPTNVKLCT